MKKKLLLMALCCLTIASLAACGNEANTDATVTETPAPTEAVVDDTTDNTDATVTEAPVATEPTVAPEETVTEAPTPTEAPKELTYAEQYAVDYPFMEIEVFENVTGPFFGEIVTGYLIHFKNNSNDTYDSAYGTLKPGEGIYIFKSALTEGVWYTLCQHAMVYPTTNASSYLHEEALQICEDDNCLVTTKENIDIQNIIFFNDGGDVVYATDIYASDYNDVGFPVKNVDNQLHIDISSISDVEWTTAKIVYLDAE